MDYNKRTKPFRKYPCDKGFNCWHLQNATCTYWHSPEEVAAARCLPVKTQKPQDLKQQELKKQVLKKQEMQKKDPECVDHPIVKGEDLMSKATEHLYKNSAQALVSAFQVEVSRKMEKALSELFKTLSVEEASRISVSTSCVNAMIVNAAKDITDTFTTKMAQDAKSSPSLPDLSNDQ